MTPASRAEVDQPLFAAALRYAGRGWPVFPLRPGEKTPLVPTGFKVATTDLDQVHSWWRRWPTANIGLATGHGFDVLDVDGEAGVGYLRAFWKNLGIQYHHAGPVSITGKGWHYLFTPTGRRNGANLLRPPHKHLPKDCDFPDCKTYVDFRGTGGYIVAPPSLHPDGHHYRWDDRRNDFLPLPAPPAWLNDLLDRTTMGFAAAKRPAIVQGVAAAMLDELRALDRPVTTENDHLATHLDFRRLDILEIAAEKGMVLHPSGSRMLTVCPYHNDSSPSLNIWPDQNKFRCFACGAFGDAYDLQQGTHFDAERAK